MRVLIADQDQQLAAQRADQLLIDGHEPVIALSARTLGLKLVELPDTVLLGELGGTSTTIALLRQLRAGACHQADNNVPVLVIGADTDTDRIRLLPRRRRRAATKRLLAAAARGCGPSARPGAPQHPPRGC
jgi:DNA-binding response OmpR family regulator